MTVQIDSRHVEDNLL